MSTYPPHNPDLHQACSDEAALLHTEPPFEFAGILGPPPDGMTLTEYLEDIDRTPMVRRLYYSWPGTDKGGQPLSIEEAHRMIEREEGL